MKLKLTKAGQALLTATINNEETIDFIKLQLGNGIEWPKNIEEAAADATELINPIMTVDINSGNVIASESGDGDDFVDLIFMFDNKNLTTSFRITEIGLIVVNKAGEEILYALGTEEEESADYVPSSSERPLEFELEVNIFVGDSENVNIILNESLSKVSWVDFRKHTEDYQNPHKTNKYHIGLGNVPNVSTNDQTPTFKEAEVLVNINSGDKLSTLFGVIKKAISSLINHLNNTDNPHQLSAKKLKAAEENHDHSAVDIKRGILSVVRGGTGNNTIKKDAVLIGNNTDPVKSVKGIGAFYSDGDGSPKFNTLPVDMGGTGLTEGASFVSGSELIEGSYGCYGSAVLPGGLLVQWGRLKIEAGEGKSPKIEFEKSFADENYVIIFTTSSGYNQEPAGMPAWNIPTKAVDHFYMCHPNGALCIAAAHVADWVAFGKAAE